MLRSSIVLIVLAIALAEAYECGKPVKRMRQSEAYSIYDYRIVGGWVAEPHSFPWQTRVMVNLAFGEFGYCGGSLIQFTPGNSTDLVLTAAHCLQNNGTYYDTSKISVIVGAHNLANLNERTRRTIQVKTYLHHDFDPLTNDNDIALIQLKEPVMHSNETIPVCLPKEHDRLPTDKKVELSQCYSAKSTLKILLEGYCHSQINQEHMFCGGTVKGGKDSCQGDSGGPFVCEVDGRYVQYGVVSFGIGCARTELPGVYAKVSAYVSWLQQNSKLLRPTSPSSGGRTPIPLTKPSATRPSFTGSQYSIGRKPTSSGGSSPSVGRPSSIYERLMNSDISKPSTHDSIFNKYG
uniref:Peptidase S1 domain-containing protein n=1 Tax=Trichuris muris TaxID=70415 RepID=A0A5S6Q342_TRIMR